MKIKLYPCDTVFSQFIRLRDGKCMRCGSKVELNDKGLPVSHQASHYFGRGRWGTRLDPENVDCLCWGCHQIWGSTNREAYRDFKIKQLGERGFKILQIRAETYAKKDLKMGLIIAKALLDDLRVQTPPRGK